MFNHGNIYTIHENNMKSDPADRQELVREGFAFWAFVFGLFWLLAERLWVPAIVYAIAMVILHHFAAKAGLSPSAAAVIQIGIQFWLGCNAYDIKRWALARRGYQMRGVVCAESMTIAQRRVFESA